jgi:ParB-like chromosome segregation protein Spo0J
MKTTKKPADKIEASGIAVHCAFDDLADIATLVANPRNTNKHPDRQIALLAKIIRHQGWRSPVVVSTRSGFVVAGHGRLQAASLLQVEKVPVNFQAFATEADEHAYMIADNRIAELAETDDETLAQLLAEMKQTAPDLDLDVTGFSTEEVDALLATINAPGEDESAAAKMPELNEKFLILITCADELDQAAKLSRFQDEGLKCKALFS